MAMIKCHECGKEISDEADKCPHCGAPPKKGVSAGSIVILVLLGILAVTFVVTTSKPPKTAASVDKFSAARGACLIVLKQSLNDPDSAKFGLTSEWYTQEQKDGTILVQPTGRAKNAYGAYIQGMWNCVAQPEGENIRVLSLKQIRP